MVAESHEEIYGSTRVPPDVEEDRNGSMHLIVIDVVIQLYKVISANENSRV